MNNKPISQTILDDNNITKDFIETLKAKLTNADHLNTAIRMFIDGRLPMAAIERDEPIDIPTIRKQIADVLQKGRKDFQERMAEHRRLSEYYASCKMFQAEGKNGWHHVFVKDGHIVAFGAESYDHRQGGIYAANNPVQQQFNWQPREHLARLRNFDKTFYKRIKKAAFADDRAFFDMTHNTIVKNK